MTHHVITAYRLTAKGDQVTITALTQSPRGTKVIVGSRTITKPVDNRSEFKKRLAEVIDELSGQPSLPL